ncbi:hypothetical protein FGO68_gene15678 [Halteria grandinella]|uniref:Uncharacterized protein n=1 Tax=Halteria grandinella TaxID=5974 RepID=A0A8J8N920_HALGN|nr:hypothetical protein FGO68_gene15678 [Halteria grandinella]
MVTYLSHSNQYIPHNIQQNMTPRLHTSLFSEYQFSVSVYGDMYKVVPTLQQTLSLGAYIIFEKPQSASLYTPLLIKIFDGLISL